MLGAGRLLFATLDRRPPGQRGHPELVGIGAFDAETGQPLWQNYGLPPLAATGAGRLYGYGRAGVLVCLGFDGLQRWRLDVPDDRSAPARTRGDSHGPFAADVVTGGGQVVVAAGPEVIAVDAETGRIWARAPAAQGTRAVADRLADAGDALICTSTQRTDIDLELERDEPELWRNPRPPEQWRTAPGELIGLDRRLAQRWRAGPPHEHLALAGRRPACVAGLVMVPATGIRSDASGRWRSSFGHRLLAFDAATGAARWDAALPSGPGAFDPVPLAAGAVLGGHPALHDAATGGIRWRLEPSIPVEADLEPVPVNGQVLFVGRGAVVAVDVSDGSARPLPDVSIPRDGKIVAGPVCAGDTLYLGLWRGGRPTQLCAYPLAFGG